MLNLTLKKTLHPTAKESDHVQQQRVEFWQLVQGVLEKDLIFLSESSVNLVLIRLLAWAPTSKRARVKHTPKRGKNVFLISAIGLQGLLTQVSLLSVTDALTFDVLIAQRLVPKLWTGAYILMGNCSIYKGESIETLIAAAWANLLYLPTYLPDSSPVENCWSKLKTVLCLSRCKNLS
jgi:transposase